MTNWKQDLNEFFREKEHLNREAEAAIKQYTSAARKFYETKVNPAFEAFKSELERPNYGRRVIFSPSGERRDNRSQLNCGLLCRAVRIRLRPLCGYLFKRHRLT